MSSLSDSEAHLSLSIPPDWPRGDDITHVEPPVVCLFPISHTTLSVEGQQIKNNISLALCQSAAEILIAHTEQQVPNFSVAVSQRWLLLQRKTFWMKTIYTRFVVVLCAKNLLCADFAK
jgi:hypothetical protein